MKSKIIMRFMIMALAFLLIIAVVPAMAQLPKHGIAGSKNCIQSKKGDKTYCEFRTEYNDECQDTIEIISAIDTYRHKEPGTADDEVVDMKSSIAFVEGDTDCVVGGSLPCKIGPGNKVSSNPLPGKVTFFSEVVVRSDDPDPMHDFATVHGTDLCDGNISTECSQGCDPTEGAKEATSTAISDLFQPKVTILKSCKCRNTPCKVNDPVDYTITVKNDSSADTPDLNCKITDTLLGISDLSIPQLAAGQSYEHPQITLNANKLPLVNTASVTCSPLNFENVITDEVSCRVEGGGNGGDVGPEEPFKAAVKDDSWIPGFYISDKLYQFTHPETSYYNQCVKYVLPIPGVDYTGCEFNGTYYVCPNKCTEKFTYDKATAVNQPEVCCTSKMVDNFSNDENTDLLPEIPLINCPDSWCDSGWCKTVKMGFGNPGTYEWVIALPKKPVGELNIEIECGVLKPNAWENEEYKAIENCAAITGEQVALGGKCTRVPGSPLKKSALPTITAIAYPGCLHPNAFAPFHLTAYKNPGIYNLDMKNGHLANRASTQVLDGSYRSRIALKACMEKTILVKWPVEGTLNAYDSDPVEDGLQPEVEANLLAGDLIKVTMKIPTANTVDIFCGKYSVTIGGIGIPIDSRTGALLDNPDSCPCIDDVVCPL